jgi:catechol 2,3-dioxygenase-like lactoylglutathione lyase family enzyme
MRSARTAVMPVVVLALFVLVGPLALFVVARHKPATTGAPGAGAQSVGQPSAAARISHIGIVVRDIERAIELIAVLTGAEKPAVPPAESRKETGLAHAAHVRLSNIDIELLEPAAGAPGPYRSFVEGQGFGVHHIGLEKDAAGSMTDQANRLVQLGGTVIASDRDRAFVDLASRLGPVVELLTPSRRDRLYGAGRPEPRLAAGAPFGRPTCVTHVGIVVRDLEQARQTHAELVGTGAPPIHQLEAATGSARYTIFKLQNVSVELLQQSPGVRGTYADFLGTDERRVHHIGLQLQGRQASYRTTSEQIAWLEQNGGKMGVDAGRFAYVDFGLGVLVEALAEETINRVYPCN